MAFSESHHLIEQKFLAIRFRICVSGSHVCCLSQCDQIGRFLKVIGGKFSYKSSPNI